MLIESEKSSVLLIDVQEKLFPLTAEHERVGANCQWLLELADWMHIPIMTTEQYPQGLGQTIPSLKKFIKEAALEKVTFSIMADDEIASQIHTHAKEHFIVVGIEAHVCVLQSVLELLALNKKVFVVVDCVTSRDRHDCEVALQRMKDAGAILVTKEMVLFEWVRKAGTDQFKALSKHFLMGEKN